MDRKYTYAIAAVCVVVLTSVIALVLINPGWEVEELLMEFDEDLGTAVGTMSTTRFANRLSKGDKLRFYGTVGGDPVDFYIDGEFQNGTSNEIIHWRDVGSLGSSAVWARQWIVPEDGALYLLTFEAYGDYSEIQVKVYRTYTKHIIPA